MSSTPAGVQASIELARQRRPSSGRKRADRFGDLLLRAVCVLAALLAVAVIGLLAYEVFSGAKPAFDKFGFGFVTATTWNPVPQFSEFGGMVMIFGTLVTSFFALALGAPIAIAIAIFLAMLAPTGVRNVLAPLVEMLAAIPSVILGFWGLLVLAPFVHEKLEPFLHDTLGFIPIFGKPETTGSSIFTASLILTIMVIPIIASVSRDLFMAVPRDLQDGAAALGSTRWEVIRGIVLPSTASGLIAASLLGLGRALGEAIAVAQVIGAGSEIHTSLFKTGDTLAARIANQFPGALTELHKSSLLYLGAILLVINLVTNLGANLVGRRFGAAGGAMR